MSAPGEANAVGNPATPDYRQRARELLASGKSREWIRQELTKLREAELLRLMHEAAVMDASPFWREIALRRFIRNKNLAERQEVPSDGA